MITKKYTILWEYDTPISQEDFLNYSSGIWQWNFTPAKNGIITITDNRGITGFFRYNNNLIYDIKSLVVDGVFYNRVYTYSDLKSTNKSFIYSISDNTIKIHFDSFEPPFMFNDISVGAVVGYSKGVIGNNKPYFDTIYYEPRIDKVFNIKKSKDPLFFGVLKYTTGTVKCFNEDGHFDDWRDRNLFAQASRILIGSGDDDYNNFNLAFQGKIENDSRSYTDFSVKLQDPRKGLTQPIATNLLNQTDYPYLEEGNIDKPKPVKYGIQKNSPCICLNETETASYYTFLLCDTEFNAVNSLTTVYVNGTAVSVYSSNLTSGTFVLTSAVVGDNKSSVTADFVATSFSNGVDIIKDLMYRYDDKTYSSTFWDISEVDIAKSISRNTSVSVDDDEKLSDVIQQVCIDIDGIFFFKDIGVYTIRIYDENREPTYIIRQDEWLSEPDIENNGSEFLSSVIIKYSPDIVNDEYLQYENTNYKDAVFDIYRTYKTTTIETNLTSLSDAQEKSESIMSISKLVGDVVTRTIAYNQDIEIMDFGVASPLSRPFDKFGNTISPEWAIWEVIGLEKNFDRFQTKLTLRYVKDYTGDIDYDFAIRKDSDGDFRMTSDGYIRVVRE